MSSQTFLIWNEPSFTHPPAVAFVEGKLILMREEKQEATTQPGVFRRVIRERGGGDMKIAKTETVRASK